MRLFSPRSFLQVSQWVSPIERSMVSPKPVQALSCSLNYLYLLGSALQVTPFLTGTVSRNARIQYTPKFVELFTQTKLSCFAQASGQIKLRNHARNIFVIYITSMTCPKQSHRRLRVFLKPLRLEITVPVGWALNTNN